MKIVRNVPKQELRTLRRSMVNARQEGIMCGFLASGGRTVTREQKPQMDLPANPRTSPRAAEGRTQSTGLGGPWAAHGCPADIPAGHRAAWMLQGGLSIFTLRTDTSCLRGRYTVLVNVLFSFLPRLNIRKPQFILYYISTKQIQGEKKKKRCCY